MNLGALKRFRVRAWLAFAGVSTLLASYAWGATEATPSEFIGTRGQITIALLALAGGLVKAFTEWHRKRERSRNVVHHNFRPDQVDLKSRVEALEISMADVRATLRALPLEIGRALAESNMSLERKFDAALAALRADNDRRADTQLEFMKLISGQLAKLTRPNPDQAQH